MSIKFRQPAIKYTNRDFDSIRKDLVEHAKRYYSDTYKDFNEASFGSMMVDAVAYIGDMLSFYLDYQANESFLSTANEYQNIIKHGKALGFKADSVPSSYGVVTLYVKVPASTGGFGIDTRYLPRLNRGTTFGSTSGTPFLLINDVNFADPKNEITVATVSDSTGLPTEYAVRAFGEVVSGKYGSKTFPVGDFQRFLRIPLREPNLTEILSVRDSEGNRYFEVDYLSQNTIYRPIKNVGANSDIVPNLLKPFVVMRRFVVERDYRSTYIQFGHGSDERLANEAILNPDDIALQRHGRDYITDLSFDPTKLIQTDKFGIAPSNTVLTVAYRTNDVASVNAGAGSITGVTRPIVSFSNPSELNNNIKSSIAKSLEVINEEPIVGDITYPSTDEVKRRIFDTFTSQNRAVTAQDYKALIYMMPGKFGSVKRCSVVQDPDAFRRNLNIYVVSEDASGNLAKTNDTIKNNLRNWINQYRMINDTIDVVDARIVNIGVDFTIVAEIERDKFSVVRAAETALRRSFISMNEIGEEINISRIYQILNSTPGVADTADVTILRKTTNRHSIVDISIEEQMSPDGRYLLAPEDVIYEIKFLDSDIQGNVR